MVLKIQKFFRKHVFVSCFLISSSILCIKIFLIPDVLEFIEPISIYTALLSSVIFIYGFMIAPAVSEYKESERIKVELKSTIENILSDIDHLSQLKAELNTKVFYSVFGEILMNVFLKIADNIPGKSNHEMIHSLNSFLVSAEKLGIPANHIIKVKQEFGMLRRLVSRLTQIKDSDSLPQVVHNLKNFITVFIISTLLFLNIGNTATETVFGEIKEGIVIFILSFIYTYLSFIITNLENPFDKRNFSGYIDMSYIKEFAKKIQSSSI